MAGDRTAYSGDHLARDLSRLNETSEPRRTVRGATAEAYGGKSTAEAGGEPCSAPMAKHVGVHEREGEYLGTQGKLTRSTTVVTTSSGKHGGGRNRTANGGGSEWGKAAGRAMQTTSTRFLAQAGGEEHRAPSGRLGGARDARQRRQCSTHRRRPRRFLRSGKRREGDERGRSGGGLGFGAALAFLSSRGGAVAAEAATGFDGDERLGRHGRASRGAVKGGGEVGRAGSWRPGRDLVILQFPSIPAILKC